LELISDIGETDNRQDVGLGSQEVDSDPSLGNLLNDHKDWDDLVPMKILGGKRLPDNGAGLEWFNSFFFPNQDDK
jgi:hypothetical protein